MPHRQPPRRADTCNGCGAVLREDDRWEVDVDRTRRWLRDVGEYCRRCARAMTLHRRNAI